MNLGCGCLATAAAFGGDLRVAFWLVVGAAVFDFLDGMTARLTRQYSEVGKQLDSLCDVVSFGVAPASVLYAAGGGVWVIFLVLFSALRLAKFNTDEEQKYTFRGLPTPASGLIACAVGTFCGPPQWVLWTITAVLCVLMVSPISVPSLKFKTR